MSKCHPEDGQQEELQDAQPGGQSPTGEGATDELGIETQEPTDEEIAVIYPPVFLGRFSS